MFSLRIVTTSHYQAVPIPDLDPTYSEFRGTAVKRVPVLRVFGSTPAGQKACMHIHGVFPYLYIPYDGTQPLDSYLRLFAASVDKALNIANRSPNSSLQHVYKISLVTGIPLYGYHPQEEQFLKIYLYNPNNVRKVADLLLGGAVMNKSFQPHEAHIPYPLQLFIDYNLYGMNFVNVKNLKFRKKTDCNSAADISKELKVNASCTETPTRHENISLSSSSSSLSFSQWIWHEENMSSEFWLPSCVVRQSSCELEVDVVAADITNTAELSKNVGTNPGLAALWEDERQRRRDNGECSQVEPDTSQERSSLVPSNSEKELLKRFLDIAAIQSTTRSSQLDSLSHSCQSFAHVPASQLMDTSTDESLSGSQSWEQLSGVSINEAMVNVESIERVVSSSQSFSSNTSNKSYSESPDKSVTDILSALLREAACAQLEDEDSILNQSLAVEEEDETLSMSQVLEHQEEETLKLGEPSPAVDSDDEMSLDDDPLPQFDGASDKLPGSEKKSSSPGATSPSLLAEHEEPGEVSVLAGSTMSAGPANVPASPLARSYPAEAWHGWSTPSMASWSQAPSWHNASPYSQSNTFNFQSPPYPQQPFQSPYQQFPYQSPTPHPYLSPSSSQSYHSPQSYQSPTTSQPYQSPTTSQPYQSPTTSQPYQSPTTSQPYQSPTTSQPYQSPTTSQPYQSPTTSQPYQSPTTSQPYHSPTTSQPYQSPSTSQAYQSPSTSQPYQSPTTSQPYQSPTTSQPYQSPSTSQAYQSPPAAASHYPPLKQAMSGQAFPASSQVYQSASGHVYPPPYQAHNSTQPCLTSYPSASQGFTSHSPPSQYPDYYCGKAAGAALNQLPPGYQRQHSLEQSTAQELRSASHERKSASHCHLAQEQRAGGHGQTAQEQRAGGHGQTAQEQRAGGHGQTAQEQRAGGHGQTAEEQRSTSQGHTAQEQKLSSQGHPLGSPVELSVDARAKASLENPEVKTVGFKSATSQIAAVSRPSASSGDLKFPSSLNQSTAASTKISTLEFKPGVTCEQSTKLETGAQDACTCTLSSTPMIQQLLMEESPMRIPIKKEDREAVMKKPMLSPSPKVKKKSKASQARPRSTSLSSPQPPPVGQAFTKSMLSSQMMPRPSRSHSISLPFSPDSRPAAFSPDSRPAAFSPDSRKQGFVPSWPQQPMQQEWNQQHGYPAHWQQLQHWEHQGQGSNGSCGLMGRLQHRSFSADAAMSPYYQSQLTSGGADSSPQSTGGQTGDKSSLSSLLQLVSDVGTQESGWDPSSTGLYSYQSPQSSCTSELRQASPAVKDLMALELSAGLDQVKSEDLDEASAGSQLKPAERNNYPCVGKQSRLKKLGLPYRNSLEHGANPSYTYTFHVPTPVFKKLKFYRGPEYRKHNFKVVRMHPMDARRYSLLKIGREMVKVRQLSEADLSRFGVQLSSYSADGSTNRVNLDIPTGSSDKRDSSSQDSSLSKFDTDFPPNKVAPPSSFHATARQVASSRSRSASRNSERSRCQASHQLSGFSPQSLPELGERSYVYPMQPGPSRHFLTAGFQQYTDKRGDQPTQLDHTNHVQEGMYTYMLQHQQPQLQAGFTSSNTQAGFTSSNSQAGFTSSNTQAGFTSSNTQAGFTSSNSQAGFTSSNTQAGFTSSNPQAGFTSSNTHAGFTSSNTQAELTSYHPHQKNELRSLGQHGLASRIDGGRVYGHSGEHTTGTSTVNTQVNARKWDSHAAYLVSKTQDSTSAQSDARNLSENSPDCQPEPTKKQKRMKRSPQLAVDKPRKLRNKSIQAKDLKNIVSFPVATQRGRRNGEMSLRKHEASPGCQLEEHSKPRRRGQTRGMGGQKERKKTPLKEGVHYIVIGKFKGHQAMVIRMQRVDVKPTEVVSAQAYQTLSSKDIVRTATLSDRTQLKSDKTAPSKLSQRYTQSQFQLYRKFRSYQLSQLEFQPDSLPCCPDSQPCCPDSQPCCPDSQPCCPDSLPKNVVAGPKTGASKSNVTCIKKDKFFSKFKQHFLSHCKSRESPSDPCSDNFFTGIEQRSFSCFLSRLAANLKQLQTGEYSSSSDDEDDFLEEMILRGKLAGPQPQTWTLLRGAFCKALLTEESFGSRQNKSLLSEESFDSRQNKSLLSEESFGSRQNKSLLSEESFGSRQNTSLLSEESFGSRQNKSLLSEESFDSRQNKSLLSEESFGSRQNKSLLSEESFGSRQNTSLLSEESFGSRQNKSLLSEESFDSRQNKSLLSEESFGSRQNKSLLTEESFDSRQNKSLLTEESFDSRQNKSLLTEESFDSRQNKSLLTEESFGSRQNKRAHLESRCEKDDFLKRQMAFFEDISSDSDSGDTIIIDVKEHFSSVPHVVRDHLLGHEAITDTTGHEAITDTTGHEAITDTTGHEAITDTTGHDALTDTKNYASMTDTKNYASMTDTKNHEAMTERKGHESIHDTKGHETLTDTKGHEAITDTKGHEAMTDRNGHEAMTDRKGHEAMTDTKGHETMTDTKGHEAMTDSKGYETMTDSKGHDAINDTKGHEAMTDTKGHEAMTDSYGHEAMTDSKGHEAMTDTKGHEAMTDTKGHEAMTDSYGHEAMTDSKGHEAMTDTKGHEAMTDSYGHEMMTDSKGHDAINDTKGHEAMTDTKGHEAMTDSYGHEMMKSPLFLDDEMSTTRVEVSHMRPAQLVSREKSSRESRLTSREMSALETSIGDVLELTSEPGSLSWEQKAEGCLLGSCSIATRAETLPNVNTADPGRKIPLKKGKTNRVKRSSLQDEGNSSSNDETCMDTQKCLRRKKHVKYAFYPEALDTSGSDSCEVSDEDYTYPGQISRQSKTKKALGTCSLDKQAKKSHGFIPDEKPGKTGAKARGRKKKCGKLLNSLSLLHMATLANLTDIPAQSDRHGTAGGSNENTAPVQAAASPALSNKKRCKGNTGQRLNSSSRNVLNLVHRQASLKPGCNGASHLGTRPLPFSRLVSSSPVPSNFTFSNSELTASEPQSAQEEITTASTLQLLESRKAQVNCASFSMKDILRLATPDESMDSDSKDGFPQVKPPEPKRAQVKSTTLSMNDILQMTSQAEEQDGSAVLSDANSKGPEFGVLACADTLTPLDVNKQMGELSAEKCQRATEENTRPTMLHKTCALFPSSSCSPPQAVLVLRQAGQTTACNSPAGQLVLPTISVTCHAGQPSHLPHKQKNPKTLNLPPENGRAEQVKPVHSLQIPSYGMVSSTSYGSSPHFLYHRPSDDSSHPLNLSSQPPHNSYSPVTPTSPISPHLHLMDKSSAPPAISTSCEPAIAAAKPLWYPWLTADPHSKVHSAGLKNNGRKVEQLRKDGAMTAHSMEQLRKDGAMAAHSMEQLRKDGAMTAHSMEQLRKDGAMTAHSMEQLRKDGAMAAHSMEQLRKDGAMTAHSMEQLRKDGAMAAHSMEQLRKDGAMTAHSMEQLRKDGAMTAHSMEQLRKDGAMSAHSMEQLRKDGAMTAHSMEQLRKDGAMAAHSMEQLRKDGAMTAHSMEQLRKDGAMKITCQNIFVDKLKEYANKVQPTESKEPPAKVLGEPSRQQSTMDSSRQQSTMDSSRQQSTMDSSRQQSTMDSSRQQSTMDSSRQQSTMDSSRQQSTMDSSRQQSTMDSSRQQSTMDSSRQQSTMDSSRQQSTMDSSRQQSTMDSSRQQSTMDSSRQQSTMDSSRQQSTMVVMSELTSGSPIDLSCHPKNQICPIINARSSGKYLEELLLHGHGWKSRIVDDYLRKGVDSDLNYETGESTTDGKKRSSVMSDSGPSVSGPSLRASLPDAPSEGSLPQGTRVGSKTLKATSLSDADVVIHPTQPAPDKACVESSLHRLGLPSVQATSVFCSDLHTPDQKLELGGKVLKVDSRRLCQMSEFTISGRHVLGLKKWRVKTERRMLSEQQPDLQVAAPVWPPPRQDTVLKWLAAGNKQQTMEHSALHPGDSSADDSLVSSLSSLADGASPCGPSPLIASDLDICSPHMSDKSFSLLLTKTPITLGKRKSKLTGVNQTKTYCNSQEDVSALSKKIRKTENKDRYPSLSSTPVNFHVDLGDGADKRHVLTQTQRRDSSTLTTDVSQIEGPTPKNTFGFKIAQTHVQDSKAIHKFQYVSTLCLELHIETRGDLRPDPAVDPVLALFYSVLDDVPASQKKSKLTGVVLVDLAKVSPSQKSPLSEGLLDKCAVDGLDVSYVQDELDLIQTFSQLVLRWDPDILVGYEIQMLSWGYLLHRAAHLNIDLCSQIARIPDEKDKNTFDAETNEWGAAYTSEIQVAGRIVLNMWRVIKHEVALNVYTFENVVYHVLHRRIPLYSFRSLTRWYTSKTYLQRWRVFEHYVRRVKGLLEVIDQLDLIGKTSEFARVFGIEFYDVLARGSQIRVESMMLRLAKPLNYVAVSPSVSQRAGQRAAECIPLTLEPESQYYTSPVVVLDFQSLYPSIMIAYNYCFSTCLGRLECLENSHEGPFEFGCSSLNIDPKILSKEKDNVTVSPNGVVFIKSSVRKGVLPMMVEEILKTRLMVKKSMKASKDDKILTRMLDARQLSLKLIANVTYGYTGASFSGRMPCIEVGDSIVRKARESLERAIDLVSTTSRWGAQVVYGDTDSLFIHFLCHSLQSLHLLSWSLFAVYLVTFFVIVCSLFSHFLGHCLLSI
ncbi:uncharacterized protein LOC131939568 isoform X2 [Physella acuta]|uniref:uncharacterized protein LOC131939568 isoform X2 n=1 Tax=Physella acuta TaxID=109671 RepID=UPI0027DD01F2|nr:uncharacterized protein LOC131939568 isoform X2 [Physella acuta]